MRVDITQKKKSPVSSFQYIRTDMSTSFISVSSKTVLDTKSLVESHQHCQRRVAVKFTSPTIQINSCNSRKICNESADTTSCQMQSNNAKTNIYGTINGQNDDAGVADENYFSRPELKHDIFAASIRPIPKLNLSGLPQLTVSGPLTCSAISQFTQAKVAMPKPTHLPISPRPKTYRPFSLGGEVRIKILQKPKQTYESLPPSRGFSDTAAVKPEPKLPHGPLYEEYKIPILSIEQQQRARTPYQASSAIVIKHQTPHDQRK